MTLDTIEEYQPVGITIDIGLKFSMFQLLLTHVKLDQLGRVSRFILIALAQESTAWCHLEQIIGLDRIALRSIKERLFGLGYLDEQGMLTPAGRAMAEIISLMDMPQKIWVDTSHSEKRFKKRLMILYKENQLREAEDLDSLLILGQKNNQKSSSISVAQQKKQLENIQATINSWRYQGIFADVLKRIWPDGHHLFDRADIINDLDVNCLVVDSVADMPALKVIQYQVNLFNDPNQQGWRFYQPVLICQRELFWNESMPDSFYKKTASREQMCTSLLSHQLLSQNVNLKEVLGENDYPLDDYFETDEAGVLNQMSCYFSSLAVPVFADIRYSFSKAYSELNLGYECFYSEASDRLQTLPLFMNSNSVKINNENSTSV